MVPVSFFDSKECEWADMSVVLAGAPLGKITGLQYTSRKTKDPLYGAGDEPISIQSGNRMYSGTLTILKGALDNMNRASIAAGGVDVCDVAFDIIISYKAKGARALQQDTLIGVEFSDIPKGWNQGATSMPITLPFMALRVRPT